VRATNCGAAGAAAEGQPARAASSGAGQGLTTPTQVPLAEG
jgi:hypothetical protein